MDYKTGLSILEQHIPLEDESIRDEFDLARGQLLANLENERRFGSTETIRNERSQIIFHKLNPLSYRFTKLTFTDVCLGKTPPKDEEPTIGILTALEHEYVTVKNLLEDIQEIHKPGKGVGCRYLMGKVSSTVGDVKHTVTLGLLPDMGNNSAAISASHLLNIFPSVKVIIMVGIAAGIPHPTKPDEHVRLGDVVVSDYGGVIQYDFGKDRDGIFEPRYRPRPPSAILIEAFRLLKVMELEGSRPWLSRISQLCHLLKIEHPPIETDIIVDPFNPEKTLSHPIDKNRVTGQPRIFKGIIASSNKVLANATTREALREQFKVKAIEMEGSGIADATWNREIGYLVVRGICDYGDSLKNDEWQHYAAVVAAAFAITLISSIPTVS